MSESTSPDPVHDHFEALLALAITESHKRCGNDQVAKAIMAFLVRAANSWLSIKTLYESAKNREGFLIDAGVILRAMFDAYLQAEYIAKDVSSASSRAADYFDFEHVDRYKTYRKWMSHDNYLTTRLKDSPKRLAGEPAVKEAYENVVTRFSKSKRPASAGAMKDSDVRNQWYFGNLRDVSQELGKADEYDLLFSAFHGCVHSSAHALFHGPPLTADGLMMWASTVAARLIQLNLSYHGISLAESDKRVLDLYNRPYFSDR